MRHLLTAFAVAALLGLSGGHAAALAFGEATVVLRADVEAVGREVTLGDIAQVHAGSVEQRRALEAIPMCFAPLGGNARTLTRDYVLLKLRQQQVDTGRITLGGADTVRIVSAMARIPADTIVTTVTEAIMAAMPWSPEEAVIEPPRSIQDLIVPGREPTLAVAFPGRPDFLGSTLARVAVYAGGEQIETASYRFNVALYREVYLAATTIPRGTVLERAHLRAERRDVATLGRQYLADPDGIVGLRARRSIRAGTRLTPAMVEAPPLVERGDRVRVRVEGQQFEISVVGQAREAGALGRIIRVDLPTRRRVFARVSGPGTAVLQE